MQAPFLFCTPLATYGPSDGRQNQPHRHPELYQLTVVTVSGGVHHIGEEQFSLAADQAYLVSPGVLHGCTGGQVHGWLLHFNAACLPIELREQLTKQFYAVEIEEAQQPLVVSLLEGLAATHSVDALTKHLLAALLHTLLTTSPIAVGQDHLTSTNHLVSGFLSLARIHYAAQHPLSWYAAALHCSTNHLSTCVLAQIGKPPKQHLHGLLLEDARQQLRFGTETVARIARELGFRDVNYFWRFFKRYTGQTPAEYRRG